MRSTPFITVAKGPHWPKVTAPDKIQSMGQIELNSVLMLNWIVWKRTDLTFKLCTDA